MASLSLNGTTSAGGPLGNAVNHLYTVSFQGRETARIVEVSSRIARAPN